MTRSFMALVLFCAVSAAQAQDAATLQARSLAANCANCHGTLGAARGAMPRLAGMPADTLVATMNAFKTGTRPATLMHQIAKGYSDEQIKLMASYFAAQGAAK